MDGGNFVCHGHFANETARRFMMRVCYLCVDVYQVGCHICGIQTDQEEVTVLNIMVICRLIIYLCYNYKQESSISKWSVIKKCK